MTEAQLPQRAANERWPVRLDHCFKRITLDAAYGDAWYRHLSRPAERHIGDVALERAIQCAEEMLATGLSALQKHNANSLRYRGKSASHQNAI